MRRTIPNLLVVPFLHTSKRMMCVRQVLALQTLLSRQRAWGSTWMILKRSEDVRGVHPVRHLHHVHASLLTQGLDLYLLIP